MISSYEIGEATIYGEWDDCLNNQFMVIWGEAGPYCTVIILSGCDYGGGVTIGSSRVPVKEAEAAFNSPKQPHVIKKAMEELVNKYKEK